MHTEDSSKIPRRTTRSSASTIKLNNAVDSIGTNDIDPPKLNDLVFGENGITFDDLLSSLPCRRPQILQLIRLLGPPNSPMVPLFLYGGASTGKTSVILQIFRHLKRPFVYSSCLTCYNPRILFESILNQLFLHRKNAGNGYSSAKRCEKPADFIHLLREALINVLNKLKEKSMKLSSSSGRMIYLIVDNMELIRDWDKSSTILPLLFNLYDLLKIPELGLIYISNSSLDAYYTITGFIEPIPVQFPNYTEDDIRQIFMRNQANPTMYSSFLDVVLGPFSRITRRVDELSTTFSLLYVKYCEPLSSVGIVPSKEMKQKLFSHLKPHIASSLNNVFRVASPHSLDVEASKGKAKKKNNASRLVHSVAFDEIDFHMSVAAKYLLISAFLASRNPATLDASLFDSTGGSDNRKRKRKNSEKSMERKETTEQEVLIKGPGTFPLERLLAIFQCLTTVSECFFDEDQQSDEKLKDKDLANNELMSDVLLQLSTLCNANFISKGGSCPLEGSCRYRSTISEDMALKVARSLKFPLAKYLYR